MKRFMRLLWIFMALNAAGVALLVSARDGAPVHNVRLTLRPDGILLYGQNSFGLLSIHVFKSWGESLAYLNRHQLSLPLINFAESNFAENILLEPQRNAQGPGRFCIKWVYQGMPKVIYAPDVDSARIFAQHLRYRTIQPDLLGFSLSLNN
ncbi:MAG: hypothetical protein JST16_04205 [Bdellovibrionales bacterium]|nr:hypothetical protein [Bdellovibrionales bacterium]